MNELLSTFQTITLDEMSGIRLMNRIDTKFVTTLPQLMRLLEMVRPEYRVQQIGTECNMTYQTTYFDTADCDMFSTHQHGRANRQKMRFRTYVDSHLQFLEVKTKNNRGRTKKKRIEVSDMLLDEQKRHFLGQHLHYDVAALQPALTSAFRRITLVNLAKTERLTIDTALCFHNERTAADCQLPQLVVIELKRDGFCPSPVLGMLRQLRIHPHGFSKYCMGSALTNSQLPVNLFKPKLCYIDKLLRY